MAGDRRATAGNVIVTDRVEKIIEIDSTSLLAIAGVPATAFEMARVLQTSFEYYRRSQLAAVEPAGARPRAGPLVARESAHDHARHWHCRAALRRAWTTRCRRREPRIYFYDPLGAQFQAVGYAASGSGSGTIRSILSFQERYGQPRPSQMNLRDAVRFASRLLTTASEFDSATGGVNPDTETYATIKAAQGLGRGNNHRRAAKGDFLHD